MIIFSDVHLDEDSADTVLGHVLPGIFKASQERQDREVACTGDFWHLRYRVDVRLQNAVRDEFKKWLAAGVHLHILPGNHDQVDVGGRNAMEVFNELAGAAPGGGLCTVYTEPTWTKHGLWVPYRKRVEDIIQALQKVPNIAQPKAVLFGHFGIIGAWMNDRIQDTDGVSIEKLSAFTRVILGHYHKRQLFQSKVQKVWYVGSPWQVTASESNQPKGYAVWDERTRELEYVDMRWGSRFHVVDITGPGWKLHDLDIQPGDEVRVTTALGVDPEVVGRALASMNVKHTVTPAVEPMQLRLDVQADAGLIEYARAYVEQVKTDLNKERLLQVFGEITK